MNGGSKATRDPGDVHAWVFSCLPTAGNTQGSHVGPMPQDTRIALFLMRELVAALRANDPAAFKCWLSGGGQDLGEPVVEELLLDRHLGLSLSLIDATHSKLEQPCSMKVKISNFTALNR